MQTWRRCAETLVLLNFFDVDTAGAQRCVELRVGDFPALALETDLLVVSAFERCYLPRPGTLIARLQEIYGIELERLPKALDLRDSPLQCWVSIPLEWDNQPAGLSRFRRIAVVEGAIAWTGEGDLLPWPPFNRLFSLLALLPMRRIACSSVATPLLGSGNQGIEVLTHVPDLLEPYRQAFRHVPELQRLILFDKTDVHLQMLGDAIDAALERVDPQGMKVALPRDVPGLHRLGGLLNDWSMPANAQTPSLTNDMSELLALLRTEQVSPISLGILARRVVEQLVIQRVAEEGMTECLNLNTGIHALRKRGADPWLISCLHQVRCFGNWMGHPPRGGRGRSVELHDLLAVLSALQRVLQDYPW